MTTFDQCMMGATVCHPTDGDGPVPVKKSTTILSNVSLPELDATCDHSHVHMHFRGQGVKGLINSEAVIFPDKMVDKLLSAAKRVDSCSTTGGRYYIHSHNMVKPTPDNFIVEVLTDLRVLAQRKDLLGA